MTKPRRSSDEDRERARRILTENIWHPDVHAIVMAGLRQTARQILDRYDKVKRRVTPASEIRRHDHP